MRRGKVTSVGATTCAKPHKEYDKQLVPNLVSLQLACTDTSNRGGQPAGTEEEQPGPSGLQSGEQQPSDQSEEQLEPSGAQSREQPGPSRAGSREQCAATKEMVDVLLQAQEESRTASTLFAIDRS